MAQAMVEKDIKKTLPLSDVLHVAVTKQNQVQFINKPAEKAISETFVNFTLQHWISYMTVARPRIRSAIREGIQDSSIMETARWLKFYRKVTLILTKFI